MKVLISWFAWLGSLALDVLRDRDRSLPWFIAREVGWAFFCFACGALVMYLLIGV